MRAIILLGICALVLVASDAMGKECSCQQHKAGASGTGSCSLAEDSNRCTITYNAGAGSSRATLTAQQAAKSFDSHLPIASTFTLLDQMSGPGDRNFRDLIVNLLSLSHVEPSRINRFLDAVNLTQARG